MAQGGDLLGLGGVAARAAVSLLALLGAGGLLGHLAIVPAVLVGRLVLGIDEEQGLAAGQGLLLGLLALADGDGDHRFAVLVGDGELFDLVLADFHLLISIVLDLRAGIFLVHHQILAQVQVVLFLVPDGLALSVHTLDGELFLRLGLALGLVLGLALDHDLLRHDHRVLAVVSQGGGAQRRQQRQHQQQGQDFLPMSHT